MAFHPGERVGPYEILSPLGRGGMGEVWRATDTRVGREVAIKVLPEEFFEDEERRRRFEREARMLASLNHPGIAVLYAFEEVPFSSSTRHLIAMELAAGEGLDAKVAAGRLPIDESLSFAAQIAEALEAAHERGVLHRDLKPSNVVVAPDGRIKLLDFGLAKAIAPEPASADVSQLATETSAGTRTGIVVGTAAYMSPEQARGQPLDRRSDIFAFGCVVYECLTGRRAFGGATVSDTMAAVLTAEPDWSALDSSVPPRLRALLKRCVQKDPARRLRDAGDARLEIEEIRAERSSPGHPAPTTGETLRRPRARTAPFVWGAAGLALGALASLAALRLPARRTEPATRVSVSAILPLPEGVQVQFGLYPAVAVSPDGATVVFRGSEGGRTRLYRRPVSGGNAEPIAGTEGAWGPFFSPDGEWLGFVTVGDVRKVAMSGGAPIGVVEVAPVSRGATWMPDGSIVVARSSNNGLFRVSASGGPMELVVPLDASRGEHAFLWPQALPGGGRVLATVVRGEDFQDLKNSDAVAVDLATGARHVLVERATFARWAPPDRLVFVRGGSAFVARMDLARLQLVGTAVPLHMSVAIGGSDGTASIDAAGQGTLVFAEGRSNPERLTTVVLLDRSGRETELPLPQGDYDYPAFSPDGRRIALEKCVLSSCKVHVFDRERGVLSPLAPEPGRSFAPVWSPDGRQVAFAQLVSNDPRAAVRAADASGGIRPLPTKGVDAEFPNAWSPDGRFLLYTVAYDTDRGDGRRRGTSDIWIVPLDGSAPPRPWLESPAREMSAAISPDGRWVAYVSNEAGRPEVYVRPLLEGASKLKISPDGGTEPAWTRGGREIVFRDRERFLTAEFHAGAEPSATAPRVLFEAGLDSSRARPDRPRIYDVTRDGELFVGIRPVPQEIPARRLAVVTDWTAALERAAGR